MSSTYAGSAATYPATITVLADSDDAKAASIAPALEALADRTAQMKAAKLVALGSVPFVSNAGNFQVGAGDYNFMSISTVTASGDDAKVTLSNLVHGATIASIDVIFVPKTTARAGWPLGSAPVITLVRCAIGPSGGTPAAPSVVSTATYVPVSQADYQNGKFKVMTVSPAHLVDALNYSYQLDITDESGANSIPGGSYLAYRINYA